MTYHVWLLKFKEKLATLSCKRQIHICMFNLDQVCPVFEKAFVVDEMQKYDQHACAGDEVS